MTTSSIISAQALGFTWPTVDPFLFCAYHDDAYPAGNAQMGPDASLAGRDMGQDFSRKDGWSMYHGQQVPGFPGHPHRGFETVTIVRKGLIDHSDSLGAAARFGGGDVQWLTAGRGIVHAEMFPLLKGDQTNPLELFQIWLNLPAKNKMVNPHFTMLWSEQIPRSTHTDAQGRMTDIAVVAGSLQTAGKNVQPLAPPPDSWAAHAAGDGDAELLVLQGQPIAEPVAQYGPFVMNTQAEIHQAIADYRATEFGGWPWPDSAPVHGREPARFARHPDGRVDKPLVT